MKIKYNAPVTLSFALAALGLQIAAQIFGAQIVKDFFSAPAAGTFLVDQPIHWLRLISHILGHGGWDHLVGNLTFILLLGPILEEKYDSPTLVVMILLTAVVTGILNVFFLPTGLMGASGIVFMMILLASFTNIKAGEIPLTFFAVAALFLGKEVVNAFHENTISEFAHIAGGISGALFGLVAPVLKKASSKASKTDQPAED